ncbi:hemolysin family protein [uncultured Methylovirgula sp.]|uniref:hemolysin family protein n=1 Tax=uncultured Methylovirgula sp. TaxID=1285960 RepID=UPI00260C801A|nr:hemolysin family protein [uncultured Methylovirgula sp.]
MSINGDPDSSHEKSGKQGLLGRLRALLGLGGGSLREDVQEAIEEITEASGFSPLEREMLNNVLSLHEIRVVDIMIPRADIIGVAYDASLAEVLDAFRTAGHSRLPVYAENLDDPRGMVHIRDLVDLIANLTDGFKLNAPRPGQRGFGDITLAESGILRPVLFAPPSMPALDLLVKMQTTRTHMALVIDEYGGTDGLASIEDVVEMIVGDIEDEHDDDETPKIESGPDGTFVVDARASLGDVSQVLGHDLSELVDAEDVDTLGGLVTNLAGHVPLRGETLTTEGFQFEVLDADPRRVKRIKIRPAAAEEPLAPGGEPPAQEAHPPQSGPGEPQKAGRASDR